MADKDPNYGNPTWHLFIAAAITGLSQAAYKKSDFNEIGNMGQRDLEDIRNSVVFEALNIADFAMDCLADRAQEDPRALWNDRVSGTQFMRGAMSEKEVQEMFRNEDGNPELL